MLPSVRSVSYGELLLSYFLHICDKYLYILSPVKGLPTINAKHHSTEIADMSLDLLDACNKLDTKGLNTQSSHLKLRIGIHSGNILVPT